MGKRRVTPGTSQLNLEIETGLRERLKAFAEERGEKVRHVVEAALRRHMDNPPPPPKPPELPPLPPVTASGSTPSLPGTGESAARAAGAGTTAKKKGKGK
jgi:hypothetical protein